MLASGADDGGLRVWDLRAFKEGGFVSQFNTHRCGGARFQVWGVGFRVHYITPKALLTFVSQFNTHRYGMRQRWQRWLKLRLMDRTVQACGNACNHVLDAACLGLEQRRPHLHSTEHHAHAFAIHHLHDTPLPVQLLAVKLTACLLRCPLPTAACCVGVCRSHITSVEWSPYESSMLATTGGDNQVCAHGCSQPVSCSAVACSGCLLRLDSAYEVLWRTL
jgi:hypothetical protein